MTKRQKTALRAKIKRLSKRRDTAGIKVSRLDKDLDKLANRHRNVSTAREVAKDTYRILYQQVEQAKVELGE